MDNDELGNVYLILIGDDKGRLAWNIVQPVPIGAMLEGAQMLEALAKQYIVAPVQPELPAPQVPPVDIVSEE